MNKLLIICGVLLTLPIGAFATPVPDTGQTTCFGGPMPCPQPGEPLYGQDAHYNINPQSFTKLDHRGKVLSKQATEWVMVRDNITGLIWEVKTDKDDIQNYTNPHDADNDYTWYDSNHGFINALNSADFGGYNDWRMPTIKELSYILYHEYPEMPSPPIIYQSYFPNTAVGFYWTSTTASSNTENAWPVHFPSGYSISTIAKSSNVFVRAVRGRQETNIFIDNYDGTVTDITTGLMWQQDGTQSREWGEALVYCENLTLAGNDDWRLPNRNELQSLVNYNTNNPAIDTNFFPNTLSSIYYTATHDVHSFGVPFGISFISGGFPDLDTWETQYIRAVRGGQCGFYGDSDEDSICNDGDVSQVVGDNRCANGETVFCDDNCPDVFNPDQEDTFPPNGNGIGDTCDCEGNFDCDEDVDGSDALKFKWDFGRTSMYDPCTTERFCYGDFDCDNDCDGSDASIFKEDFGRSSFGNSCPACVVGDWCVYE